MKFYKIAAIAMVFYTAGYIFSAQNTKELYEQKIEQVVREQRELRATMIESEVEITREEAYESFMEVLIKSCMSSGKFMIYNQSTSEQKIFKCELEGKGDFMAWR